MGCIWQILSYSVWSSRLNENYKPDFIAYQTAAILTAEQRSPYDLAAQGEVQQQLLSAAAGTTLLPYLYPPHSLWLFMPYAEMPYAQALPIWVATQIALLPVIAGLMLWYLQTAPLMNRILCLAVLLLHPIVVVVWMQGQITMLLLAAMGLFLYGLQQQQRGWMALALLLLLIKPQIAVAFALYVVLSRDTKLILLTLLAGLAAILATAPILPLGTWIEYPFYVLQLTHESSALDVGYEVMISLTARIASALPEQGLARDVITIMLLVLAIGISSLLLERGRGKIPTDIALGLSCCLCLWLSPWLHRYDLLLYLFPALIFYRAAAAYPARYVRPFSGAILLLSFAYPFWPENMALLIQGTITTALALLYRAAYRQECRG